jgi:hypothetical protein
LLFSSTSHDFITVLNLAYVAVGRTLKFSMSDRAPKRGRPSTTTGNRPKDTTSSHKDSQNPKTEPSEQGFSSSYYTEGSAVHRSHSQRPPVLSTSYTQAQTQGSFSPSLQSSQTLQSAFAPPPAGKLLLPPLPRSQGAKEVKNRKDKHRTAHACEKCRKAKAKCSGGVPCAKCRNEGKICVYGDGKRDKERK